MTIRNKVPATQAQQADLFEDTGKIEESASREENSEFLTVYHGRAGRVEVRAVDPFVSVKWCRRDGPNVAVFGTTDLTEQEWAVLQQLSSDWWLRYPVICDGAGVSKYRAQKIIKRFSDLGIVEYGGLSDGDSSLIFGKGWFLTRFGDDLFDALVNHMTVRRVAGENAEIRSDGVIQHVQGDHHAGSFVPDAPVYATFVDDDPFTRLTRIPDPRWEKPEIRKPWWKRVISWLTGGRV